MGTIALPTPLNAFELACLNFETFPSNLVDKPTFLSALQAYETRLKDPKEGKALFAPEGDAYVAFRDLNPDGQSKWREIEVQYPNN
jgi:hypothetical protein